jgi:hypothetical protein
MNLDKMKRNGGQWTEARFHSFVVGGLRTLSRKWGPRNEALSKAFTRTKVNTATGRLAKHYKCAGCEKEFPGKLVAADHIEPVVDPSKGFVSWDVFIDRLLCEVDGYQILCKNCHDAKTAEERIVRCTTKKIGTSSTKKATSSTRSKRLKK